MSTRRDGIGSEGRSARSPRSAPRPLGAIESVALAVNPRAGQGAQANLEAARRLLAALVPARVLTGAGELGGDAVDEPVVLDLSSGTGNPTSRIAEAAALERVDLLVVVGGDGTLADAALGLARHASAVPIFGLGGGSTNAGALVSCRAAELATLDPTALVTEHVSALSVAYPVSGAALAFNDVVVGTSVCGTVDGAFVNLDAKAFKRGEKVPTTPARLCSTSASVVKLHARGETRVAGGAEVGSVVVGFTRTGDVSGQALLGGLGLSAGAGVPAGCLVATTPLVFAGFSGEDHALSEPIRTSYVGLSESETLRLSGFGPEAVLCADGNPLKPLEEGDVVDVSLRNGACSVVRLVGGSRR